MNTTIYFKKRLHPLWLLAIVFLTGSLCINSCSSGKKAYERGDYYTSVLQSIQRLRNSSTNKNARSTLQKAYPEAVRYYTKRVDDIKKTNAPFRNEQILTCYQRLNGMYNELQRCPACLNLVGITYSYAKEEAQFRNLAAEERYQAGLDALSRNTRDAAMLAIEQFECANSYVNGYKDIQNKIAEAYEKATLKVVVDQLPVPTVAYQLSVEFFQDKIDEYIANFSENRFVKFLPPTDENFNRADQVLMLRFDEFQVGNTRNTERITDLTSDSVVVGTVKLEDGQTKNVYGTVKAKLTEYHTEVLSNGLVTMKIIDNRTNSIQHHNKFAGEFVWVNSWATYNGDERALSQKQLHLTKKRFSPPPPPQTLFIEFCYPIYDQISNDIHSYYRNR